MCYFIILKTTIIMSVVLIVIIMITMITMFNCSFTHDIQSNLPQL
jgi:hypothetical protein